MSKIINIKARQVFDSRGYPTLETDVTLDDGSLGSAIVPSGASTGSYEAHELRDQNSKYLNKSVFNAVENVNILINNELKNKNSLDQENIDQILIDLDQTKNKSKLGANSILSVSIANCKAAAKSQDKEIFQYLSKDDQFNMPYPLMNIINGGAHANNSLNIQEFMIRPDGAKNFQDCMQMAFLIIQNLKKTLEQKKLNTSVGDEGGFAPN
jgi:enolase